MQHMEALAKANEVRLEGVRQRRELVGKPASEIAAALLDPTPALGRVRLRFLLSPTRQHQTVGLIPQVGPGRLGRALHALARDTTLGRVNWHAELRLDELSERERKRLVEELLKVAPSNWAQEAA